MSNSDASLSERTCFSVVLLVLSLGVSMVELGAGTMTGDDDSLSPCLSVCSRYVSSSTTRLMKVVKVRSKMPVLSVILSLLRSS